MESSVSVAVAVSALCYHFRLRRVWRFQRVGWNYSLLDYDWMNRVSIAGSITFSRVVSIWAGSVTSKSCNGTSTSGLLYFWLSYYFSGCNGFCYCFNKVVQLLALFQLELFRLGLVLSISTGADSTWAASMFMIGSCGAGSLLVLEEQFLVLVHLLLGLLVLGLQLERFLLELLR